MNVVLISTYDLGRQPWGLASPAAWLKPLGASVSTVDLAVQDLPRHTLAAADLIAFHLPMHTATRIAASLIPQVKKINPRAHLCFYGLYAPVNEAFLRTLGAQTILGGEFEAGLAALVKRLSSGAGGECSRSAPQPEPVISLARQQFQVPDRSGLPGLSSYAYLTIPDGERRTVGYTETSRGCKHVCRHCPIVPVYEGRFRIVQEEVVLEDIRRQVERGARHITFGDPDFLNGPKHALSVVASLHREFPEITYDVTIKVEHLLNHAELLPNLRDTGCLFVTSAVESFDNRVLEIFAKHHTREDFERVVALFRTTGLALNPTFVSFTPWTSLTDYQDFLDEIVRLDLVENVSPIQYAIRLLIPAGSKLLELAEVRAHVGAFSQSDLCYPWKHEDPRVDRLYSDVLAIVKRGECAHKTRRETFLDVWERGNRETDAGAVALHALGLNDAPARVTIPYLSEPWFC